MLTRFSARTRTMATLAAASLTTLALAVVHQPVARIGIPSGAVLAAAAFAPWVGTLLA